MAAAGRADTTMPNAPPPIPSAPSFSDLSDRYTELSNDLINKLNAIHFALVEATAIRRETLATLSTSFQDPHGPPPIPAMVRAYAPLPSGDDMTALTAQLRRRITFDAYQMSSHLIRHLRDPLARARSLVHGCRRAASYQEAAAGAEEQQQQQQQQQRLAALRVDTDAVRRARDVVGRGADAALRGDRGAQGELRWFDYVVGVGPKRSEEQHRRQIEGVYYNIACFEELGHTRGDDMRYLVTACREFQGFLAEECLARLVEAVRRVEVAWGREFVWDKSVEEAREAERTPEPVEGVSWELRTPESTEKEGGDEEDVRSEAATTGGEADVAVMTDNGVALDDIQKRCQDETALRDA